MKRLAAALALVALCASCQKFGEGRQLFRDLLALRDQIAKQFDERNVDIRITNGDRMAVKFIDSPMIARSHEEKQKRADEVAMFVTAHYKHPLAGVMTVYVAQSGGFGVTVNQSEAFVGHPAR